MFGLKPTWGVVSPKGQALPGTHADADISVVGPLARGAADLDLALDVMAGPDMIDGVAWELDQRDSPTWPRTDCGAIFIREPETIAWALSLGHGASPG